MTRITFGMGKMSPIHTMDGSACPCVYALSTPYLIATHDYRTQSGIWSTRPDLGMRYLVRTILTQGGHIGFHLYTSSPMQTAADLLHFSSIAAHARSMGRPLTQKEVHRFYQICAELMLAYERKGWPVPETIHAPYLP